MGHKVLKTYKFFIVLLSLVVLISGGCQENKDKSSQDISVDQELVVEPGETQYDIQFVVGTKKFDFPNSPMPAKGKTIIDKYFHTRITRLTDKKIDKYPGPGIQNEYAKTDPENSNGTVVVLRDNGGDWLLYDTKTYKPIKRLDEVFSEGNQEPEPRWDQKNPNVFYFLSNMQLKSYDFKKDKIRTVHDFKKEFPKGSIITTGTEGDASLDRRYWSFMVVGEDENLLGITVYDRIKDKVLGKEKKGLVDELDWIGMDMSGEHVIVGYETETFIQIFNRDLSKKSKLVKGSNAHGDLAHTNDGQDVFVYQNIANDHIAMSDLNTGQETKLLEIPFGVNTDIGLHVSGNCSQTPGWVLISTYGSKNPPPNEEHSWMDCQLFMLELKDKPRIWRIAHTNAFTSLKYSGEKNYFAECFAAINSKGTRIYFGSNWNRYKEEYSDTYLVTLPAGWTNKLPE